MIFWRKFRIFNGCWPKILKEFVGSMPKDECSKFRCMFNGKIIKLVIDVMPVDISILPGKIPINSKHVKNNNLSHSFSIANYFLGVWMTKIETSSATNISDAAVRNAC